MRMVDGGESIPSGSPLQAQQCACGTGVREKRGGHCHCRWWFRAPLSALWFCNLFASAFQTSGSNELHVPSIEKLAKALMSRGNFHYFHHVEKFAKALQ